MLTAKAGYTAGTSTKILFVIAAVAIQAVLPLLGHAAVLKVLKILAIPFVALFVIMAVITAGKVSLHAGQHSASPGAMLIALALIISAGGLSWTGNANDYSRYLPPSVSKRRIAMAVALGGTIPSVLLETLGAGVATSVPGASTVNGLISGFPGWFVVPYLVLAVVQLFTINTIDLYSSGVTLQSLIPLPMRSSLPGSTACWSRSCCLSSCG